MAPVGMVDALGWFTPPMGIISLVVFFVLSITLVALCASCPRNTTNAYDVSGTTTDGANGTAGTKTAGGSDTTWRNHNSMPPSTLERSKAYTN